MRFFSLIIFIYYVAVVASSPMSWREVGLTHIQHCSNSQHFHPPLVVRNRSHVSVSNPSGTGFGGWIEYEIGDMRMYGVKSEMMGYFFMSFSSNGVLSLIPGNPPTRSLVDMSDSRVFVRRSVAKRKHRREVLFHVATQQYVHVMGNRPNLTSDQELATPLCYN